MQVPADSLNCRILPFDSFISIYRYLFCYLEASQEGTVCSAWPLYGEFQPTASVGLPQYLDALSTWSDNYLFAYLYIYLIYHLSVYLIYHLSVYHHLYH